MIDGLTSATVRKRHINGGHWERVRTESETEHSLRRHLAAERKKSLMVLIGKPRPVYRWRWL